MHLPMNPDDVIRFVASVTITRNKYCSFETNEKFKNSRSFNQNNSIVKLYYAMPLGQKNVCCIVFFVFATCSKKRFAWLFFNSDS